MHAESFPTPFLAVNAATTCLLPPLSFQQALSNFSDKSASLQTIPRQLINRLEKCVQPPPYRKRLRVITAHEFGDIITHLQYLP
jgi:hypothetical protein